MKTHYICLIALLLSSPQRLEASPVDLWGFGAKGSAMGGAYATLARDHEAVYYNPAGLAFAEKPSVAFGFQYADLKLEINGAKRSVPNAPALTIGFGLPLNLGGVLAQRLSLGLGFVLPQTSVLLARTPIPQTPHFPLLEYRAQTISLQGCIAVRVTDWFSLGAGFLALSGLEGAVDAAPNATGVLSAEVEDALLASYSPIIGGLIKGPLGLSFATVFRGASAAKYHLPVTADLGDSFPIEIPLLDLYGTAQYDPEQWTFEFSWRQRNTSLSVATTFKRWSAFPNPIHYPAVPEGWPEQPTPGLQDQWLLRLGGEWNRELFGTAMAIRGGYVYEPSPVPDHQDFHNYVGNDRQIFSGGLGMSWRSFSLNLSAQWHHLMPETRSSSPLQKRLFRRL
jgi:long-chain fatty acid transport protein